MWMDGGWIKHLPKFFYADLQYLCLAAKRDPERRDSIMIGPYARVQIFIACFKFILIYREDLARDAGCLSNVLLYIFLIEKGVYFEDNFHVYTPARGKISHKAQWYKTCNANENIHFEAQKSPQTT